MAPPEPAAPEEVYLLGCGRSVLDLTPAEVERINRAPCRLALNKFAAFADSVGIVPTHVWFTEYHHPSYRVLQYIFDRRARLGPSDLTFVMGHRTGRIFESRARHLAETLFKAAYYKVGMRLSHRLFPSREPWNYFHVPRKAIRTWRIDRVESTHEVYGPRAWASTLDEPLFHHRTAFTAALNYLSVIHPTARIRLVGSDFNGPGYFFDDEMKRRGIRWEDYTTGLQADRKQHFAAIADAIPDAPGTVFDVFPFMRESILARGGSVACSNPASATITRGLADYEPIPVADPSRPAEREPARAAG